MNLPLRFVAGIVFFLVSGCTSFDPLDQRGETINRNATDYANDATLLNVVRATLQEPLSFVTITGLSGTESATGSLGLPAVTFGFHPAATPKTYSFGTNSISRTNSNTFNIAVVDDPASFVALLSPINPAVIASLARQGYSTPFLFFLVTDELRDVRIDSKTNTVSATNATYFNDPDDPNFGNFIDKMADLLVSGLVAQIDVTAIPSGKNLPASRLCIDPAAVVPSFGGSFVAHHVVSAKSTSSDPALCDRVSWIEADTPVALSPAGGGVAAAPAKKSTHLVAYQFKSLDGHTYQLFPRSTYGIYAYLARFIEHPIDDLLPKDESGQGNFMNLQDDRGKPIPQDCFAAVEYRGIHYCIPQKATNSKRLFAFLHLLQQLQTAPSNAPTTLTVTSVPG